MNFKVIYKGKTHESVVADEMKLIDANKLATAFMVVATENVEDPTKPYIAIQLHENVTMIGTKNGATRMEASSILDALNGGSEVCTVIFLDKSGYATSIPESVIAEPGTSVTLNDPVYDEDKYRFDGWVYNGEVVTSPITVEDDMKLEASWTLMQKVTFTDPDNHAESLPETIIAPKGTSLADGDIPDPTPKTGYTFAGYKIGNNDLQYPLVLTHDFTLKATFTED